MTREYTSYGWRDGDKASHWGVSLDLTKPTTGVVNIADVEFIGDEMFNSDAIDLDWQEHCQECKGQCSYRSPSGHDNCHCNHSEGKCDCYGVVAHDYDPDESEHERCGPQERGTILIGSWKLDPETKKFEPDETGEYAAICNEIYAQVVWSKTVVRVKSLCSPCYPGQANVERDEIVTEGGYLAYDFPASLYGDGGE